MEGLFKFGNRRDAAMFVMALAIPKIIKYVYSKGANPWGGNLSGDFSDIIAAYFKERPVLEKISRYTEYNVNGDYSVLVNRIINAQ